MVGHLRSCSKGSSRIRIARRRACRCSTPGGAPPVARGVERRSRRDYPRSTASTSSSRPRSQRTPDAVAVVRGDRSLTYRELESPRQPARARAAQRGVGPEVLVGVCLERSLELVVALLGVLKAGGAYVPLDPEYPKDRLAFMLEDAQASGAADAGARRWTLAAARAQVLRLDRVDRTCRASRTTARPRWRSRPSTARLRDLHLGLDRAAQGGDERAPR